jgi:hypothetical protein
MIIFTMKELTVVTDFYNLRIYNRKLSDDEIKVLYQVKYLI